MSTYYIVLVARTVWIRSSVRTGKLVRVTLEVYDLFFKTVMAAAISSKRQRHIWSVLTQARVIMADFLKFSHVGNHKRISPN